MDIRSYIAAAERTYSYRIKTVVPLDDHAMSRIERSILKYQPISITNPKKTIFQRQPLDFPTIQGAEVYFVDVVLAQPASGYVMQQELVKALSLPEKYVVVRADNEPNEVELARLNAHHDMQEEANEKGLEPAALLDDATYMEAGDQLKSEELYGDEYNKRFLGYLKKVETERKEKMKVDAPNSLFKWLDLPKSDVEEDKGPIETVDGGGDPHVKTSPYGNFDNDAKKYYRVYKKGDKAQVLSRDGQPVRKGK